MAIPPGFVDELRTRLRVSDIVGKRVKLVKKGREHSGLCPFHNEKTPSFTVNDDKGFYHCFGCGAHGSALDFVMNTEGLNFPEAVERLASSVGMTVPEDTPQQRERAEKRKTLYDVTEQATVFYERLLKMPEGREGYDYLKRRGLSDQTLKTFRLGFAPATPGSLKAALKREGLDDTQLIEAGLLIRPDDPNRPPYERFRNRVMFPITDRRGRVIAFGGRILGDGKPKYLNSPETPLFHKGSVLYGLAQARETAHKSGEILVTEGYMDVIALAQAGFRHAVAPLGTALTPEQIDLLWRMAPSPLLCFDGDAAGQRAALKAAERGLEKLKPGYGLHFAHIKEGDDPDSLIQKGGVQAMQSVIENAIPLSELLWQTARRDRKLDRAEDRALLEEKLKQFAFQIENESVRSHFLSALKDRMWQEIRRHRQPSVKSASGFIPFSPKVQKTHLEAKSSLKTKVNTQESRECLLIGLVITQPEIIEEIGEELGLVTFQTDWLDKLRQEVLKTFDGEMGLGADQLCCALEKSGYRTSLLTLFDRLQPMIGRQAVLPGEDGFEGRPLTDLLEDWHEVYDLYVKDRDWDQENKELKQRLKDDFSAENLQRYQAHQKLKLAHGLDDPEEENNSF